MIKIVAMEISGIIDANPRPDYHAACHAVANSPPFLSARSFRLLFLFRRRRTDRSSRVEQGAWPGIRPYGVCGRHGPGRLHGRACLGQRVDRRAQRRLETSHSALRVDGAGRRATAAVSLAGLAGVRAAYVARVSSCRGERRRFAGTAVCGRGARSFSADIFDGRDAARACARLARSSAELGTRLSRLYWVNTAGAVAGTFAAGFLLLPTLGLRRTLGIAVALNLLAGALALWFARGEQGASRAAECHTGKLFRNRSLARRVCYSFASPLSAPRPCPTKSAGRACSRRSSAARHTRSR